MGWPQWCQQEKVLLQLKTQEKQKLEKANLVKDYLEQKEDTSISDIYSDVLLYPQVKESETFPFAVFILFFFSLNFISHSVLFFPF